MHTTSTAERAPNRAGVFGIVFVLLAVFTALEVGVAYIPALPGGLKIGLLIFLAVVKVTLVLLYFMHLRYDNNIFALPFALGVVLLVPIVLAVGLTQKPAPNPTDQMEAPLNLTGQVIDVSEVSFNIRMSQYTAQAGPVTFHIVNNADSILHEFLIFKTDLKPDELPTDDNGRVIEDALTRVTGAEDIPSANGRNITVNLEAGHYVMICNLPDHYAQGMRVEFTVTGTNNQPVSTPESTAAPLPTATSGGG